MSVEFKVKQSIHSRETIMNAIKRQKELDAATMLTKRLLLDSVVASRDDEHVVQTVQSSHLVPKIDEVASYYIDTQRDMVKKTMLAALSFAGGVLRKYRLVPGMPTVVGIKDIKVVQKTKPFKYVLNDFPRLKKSESFLASAELFERMCHEAIGPYRAYCEAVAATCSIPPILLTSDKVKVPFSPDLFRRNANGNVGVKPGDVMKELGDEYISSLDGILHVLWGDGGKLVLPVMRRKKPSLEVVFVFSRDYPYPHYEKYKSFLGRDVDMSKLTSIVYEGTMLEYLSREDLSNVHVYGNYMPMIPIRALSVFAFVRNRNAIKGKVIYVPPSSDTVKTARFIETFHHNEILAGGVTFLDVVNDIHYRYDQHNVWADRMSPMVGIPMQALMDRKNPGTVYNGTLSLIYERNVQCEGGDNGISISPPSVSSLVLQDGKYLSFPDGNISALSYIGMLGSLHVESTIVYLDVDGRKYILDADIGGFTYIERRLRLLAAGLPVVPYDSGGELCAPYDAQALAPFVRISLDMAEDGVDVLSRISFKGVAVVGGMLVRDYCSPFFPVGLRIDSDLKSDQQSHWRARFIKSTMQRVGGFMFCCIDGDPLFQSPLMVADIDSMGLPPHYADELRALAADWTYEL